MVVSDIEIGGRLYFGRLSNSAGDVTRDMLWTKVDRNDGFLSMDNFGGYAMDMPEPDNESRDRRERGSNFFPQTNLCQFLNASGKQWYKPQHDTDCIASLQLREGFLTRFEEEELSAIVPHEISVTVPCGFKRKFGDIYKATLMVSIPSKSQFMSGVDTTEGEGFEYFAANIRLPQRVFTRTAHGSGIVSISRSGEAVSVSPASCQKFTPYIRINGQTQVEFDPTDNVYYIPSSANEVEKIKIELDKVLN